MLQHNKERIAGVDVAADDIADIIMMIKITVYKDDGDKDDNYDNDDEFNPAELRTIQESL